jgi:hypothetical protein
MKRWTRAGGLVGTEFENTAQLPGGLVMTSEATLEERVAVGATSVVAAMASGERLFVLVSRVVRLQPRRYRIIDAVDLGRPCAGLEIVAGRCKVGGKPDRRVFALADARFKCGRGERSPVRAWRVRGNVVAAAIRCGRVTGADGEADHGHAADSKDHARPPGRGASTYRRAAFFSSLPGLPTPL